MMNDETFSSSALDDDELDCAAGGMATVQETMDTFLSAAGVHAVYGEPVGYGESIVLPAAEVVSVMGFGLGYGGGAGSTDRAGSGFGGGGGGGGRVLSRPVAAIIISPGGVRVDPIVDVTKLGLAALTAFGFMATMAWRMSRRGHK
jgi:uncharacterized spore protein YtfJ